MKKDYYYEMNHSYCNRPIYVWHLSSKLAHNVIYCNWHQAVEFIYVKSGSLQLYIDEHPLFLTAGDIGIINRNRLHYGFPPNGTDCDIAVFVYDFDQLISPNEYADDMRLRALVADELWFPSQLKAASPHYEEILASLQQIFEVCPPDSAVSELRMKSLVFHLLDVFASSDGLFTARREWGTGKSREHHQQLLALNEYLEAHYQEDLSVSRMASALLMGKDTFYKFMVTSTGRSPIDFLHHFRLQKALKLLSDTDIPVTDICYQSGFSNVSYFIKCFRKTFGVTPKQYRTQQLANNYCT